MPKILETEVSSGAIGPLAGFQSNVRPEEPKRKDVSFLQTMGAAFRLDNSAFSIFSAESGQGAIWNGINMGFDADEFVPDDLVQQGYGDRYIYAQNAKEVAAITTQIRREIQDRETLAAAGGWGVAMSIAAGVLDPINLIPVGGATVKAIKGGKMALQVGKSAALAGLASTTVVEGVLQASQQTRTAEESVINIAAGTVLSGVLGSGVGALADLKAQGLFTKSFEDMANELGVAMSIPAPPTPVAKAYQGIKPNLSPQTKLLSSTALESSTALSHGGQSVGAAVAVPQIPDVEAMKPASGFGLSRFVANLPTFGKEKSTFDPFNTPQLRNLESGDQDILWAQWRLTGSPLIAQGHLDGTFTSPQNVLQNIMVAKAHFVVPIDRALKAARKEYKQLVKEGKAPKLSQVEFEDQIFLAAKFNIDTGIKPIDDAKQVILGQFAEYTKKLRELGYEVDDGYMPQQMVPRAIASAESDFIELMREKLEREIKRAGQKVVSADKAVAQIKSAIKTIRSEMVRRSNAAYKAAYREVLKKH